MAHAVKVVCPPDVITRDTSGGIAGTEEHPDKIMRDLIADYLAFPYLFCTDIGEKAQNAFHFLFASNMLEYFELCREYHDSIYEHSGLSEIEIQILSPHLVKLEQQERIGEVEALGADIYVISARYKKMLFISHPVIRTVKPGSIFGEKDHTISTWDYALLTERDELKNKIIDQAEILAKELKIIKPLIFGFSLNDSGDPVLVEIIPNFGLTAHSVLPAALTCNKIDVNSFLVDAYRIA